MSDTIFEVIYQRIIEWPNAFPEGNLDLVDELISLQGRVVIATSLGAEYVDLELPYENYSSGKTENLKIGVFMNNLVESANIRDA